MKVFTDAANPSRGTHLKFSDFVTTATAAASEAVASEALAADLAKQAAVARTEADHDAIASATANQSVYVALVALGGYVADIVNLTQYVAVNGTVVTSALVTADAEVPAAPSPEPTPE